MGPGLKIGLAVGAIVVVLAVGAFFFLQQRGHTPSEALVKAEVEKDIANPLLRIDEIKPVITMSGSDAADIQYHAVAELHEALYEQADTATILRDDLKLDVDAWRAAQQTLTDKDAARILELAGLKGLDDTLLQTTYLKETSPKGFKVTFDGRLRATKTGSDWHLEPQGAPVSAGMPTGQPRTAFPGHTSIPSDPAEMEKLRDLAKAQADVPAKIEQGRMALEQERQAAQQKVLAQMLGDLASGSLFAGTATSGTGAPDRLFLEITGLQENEKQLTALLRNDGGWSDARAFKGGFVVNSDNRGLTVTLVTLRNQVVRKGGPLLDRNESWQVVLNLSEGKLTGHSGNSDYSFARLSPAEAAAARNELEAEATAMRAATAVGKVYRGTVRAKVGTESFECQLRFNRQDEGGNTVGLVLEPLGHESWQRAFRGTIIGSRTRAEGWPLRLETGSRDAVRAAAGSPLVSVREDYSVSFKLAGSGLLGESKDFIWDFAGASGAAGASGDEVAKSDTDQGDGKKQIFALVKVGTSFTGRALSADGAQVERVRVRFTLVDLRNGVVEALLESLETSGVSREFRGGTDLTAGRLVLTSSGRAGGNPGRAVHLPAFTDADAEAAISFGVADEKLNGELKPAGWKLEF